MKLLVSTLCSDCFNVKNMLPEKHGIEIIDIMQRKDAIEIYGILVVPTLIDNEGKHYTEIFEIIQKLKKELRNKK
ncbi:MAG: hypothetical protein PHN69_02490 [Candidatus Pacebacteria bacterium]|nr:hypothetical protein [Candidatus Paceibacterota bacterium]